MTPTQKKVLLIALILLGIGGAGLLFVRLFGDRNGSDTNTPSGSGPTGSLPGASNGAGSGNGGSANLGDTGTGASGDSAVPTATEEEKKQQLLLVASRDFAERYGSYSSEGDYQNLETLLAVMTPSFRAETEASVLRSRSSGASAQYVGVTTKALSVKPEGSVGASSSATVRVLTQRTTSKSRGDATVTYEELLLTLRYEQDVWKVDGARWQAL